MTLKSNLVSKSQYNFKVLFCDLVVSNSLYFDQYKLFLYKKFMSGRFKLKLDIKNFKLNYFIHLNNIIGDLVYVYYFRFEKLRIFKGKIIKIFKKNNNVNFIIFDKNSNIFFKFNLNNINILLLLLFK